MTQHSMNEQKIIDSCQSAVLLEKMLSEGLDPNCKLLGQRLLVFIKDPQICQLLLEAGADPNAMSAGVTAFEHMVLGFCSALSTVGAYQKDMIELMTKYGARDVHHLMVDRCIEHNRDDLAYTLMHHGFKPSIKGLRVAVGRENKEMTAHAVEFFNWQKLEKFIHNYEYATVRSDFIQNNLWPVIEQKKLKTATPHKAKIKGVSKL